MTGTARSRVALAVLVFAGYATVATVVEVYPFSSFDMYAHPESTASKILARTDQGVFEVRHFHAWQCDRDDFDNPLRCGKSGGFSYTQYKDAEATRWVRGHSGNGAAAVDIVRRIWFLDDNPGAPRYRDCVVATCRAQP